MKGKIPNVPASVAPEYRRLLDALKETVEVGEGTRGDPLRRKITLKDLMNLKLITMKDGFSGGGSAGGSTDAFQPNPYPIGGSNTLDLTPPPQPTGFAATGALVNNLLSWDWPEYSNHSYTEVWRAEADNIATAVLIGTSDIAMYPDTVDPGATFYYWIRFVSNADKEGPFNASAGTVSSTGEDPAALYEILQGRMLHPDATDETDPYLNFTVFEGKTVMDAAYIVNLMVNNAQIQNLSVDKLIGDKAAFVSANIGDGTIGSAKIADIIQSTNYSGEEGSEAGWMLNKAGLLVANNALVRGTIRSSTIIGSMIDGSLLVGQSLVSIPTEYDDGTQPRYLAFQEAVNKSDSSAWNTGSTASGWLAQVTGPTLAIASSAYTGDGTESVGGNTYYKDRERYINNIISLNFSAKATFTSDNYQSGWGQFNNGVRVILQFYNISTGTWETLLQEDFIHSVWTTSKSTGFNRTNSEVTLTTSIRKEPYTGDSIVGADYFYVNSVTASGKFKNINWVHGGGKKLRMIMRAYLPKETYGYRYDQSIWGTNRD